MGNCTRKLSCHVDIKQPGDLIFEELDILRSNTRKGSYANSVGAKEQLSNVPHNHAVLETSLDALTLVQCGNIMKPALSRTASLEEMERQPCVPGSMSDHLGTRQAARHGTVHLAVDSKQARLALGSRPIAAQRCKVLRDSRQGGGRRAPTCCTPVAADARERKECPRLR